MVKGLKRIVRVDKLTQTFVVRLVIRLKTDPKRIVLQGELSLEMRHKRRIRLVPVFILKTHHQTNCKCFPKFVQTDNAS